MQCWQSGLHQMCTLVLDKIVKLMDDATQICCSIMLLDLTRMPSIWESKIFKYLVHEESDTYSQSFIIIDCNQLLIGQYKGFWINWEYLHRRFTDRATVKIASRVLLLRAAQLTMCLDLLLPREMQITRTNWTKQTNLTKNNWYLINSSSQPKP